MSDNTTITTAEHWALLRRVSERALHDAVVRTIDATMAAHAEREHRELNDLAEWGVIECVGAIVDGVTVWREVVDADGQDVVWGSETMGPHTPDCPCPECCQTCGAQPGWPCAEYCAYADWCDRHMDDFDVDYRPWHHN